jgi:hypothetical protein
LFCSLGIALIPNSLGNEPASVTYSVEGGASQCLVGRATVDDDSVDTARPVVVQVLTDGAVLYSSPSLRLPGDSFFFRVPLHGASEVTLRAILADSSTDRCSADVLC